MALTFNFIVHNQWMSATWMEWTWQR